MSHKPLALKHTTVEIAAPGPFWGWSDLLLYVIGMALLIGCLYQLVLQFGLPASVAGAITDVPGPLGILYLVLRLRYKREPWAELGWRLPRSSMDWVIAVLGGVVLGAWVMGVENPSRSQIHFHTMTEAIIFGGFLAGLVEETTWRGAVLPLVLRHMQPFLAALSTGILFAFSHGIYKERIPSLSALAWITLTGTSFGLMRIKSNSTLTAAAMHTFYNLTLFFWQGA